MVGGVKMQKAGPIEVPEEELRLLLEKGECPAANTTCRFLIKGKCSLEKPKLYYRLIKREGYSCGSYLFKL